MMSVRAEIDPGNQKVEPVKVGEASMIMCRMTTHCIIGASMLAARCGQRVPQGTEFVVDQGHAHASDLNPGAVEKPFKTIQAAVDKVQPGDTIWVKAGQYEEPVEIRTSGASTPRSPFQPGRMTMCGSVRSCGTCHQRSCGSRS